MKKRLFITISIFLVLAIILLGSNYALSLHKVTFTIKDTVSGVSIYNSDDKKIKQLSSDESMLLQKGKYYVIPEGQNIATNKITFIVDKSDISVAIDPPYTKEYLEKALRNEQPAIEAAVTAKYPSLIAGYTLTSGALYKQGEWFGGLLKPKVHDPRQQKDPYKIVLHKKDDQWGVVRRPEYVLTSSRYREVPIDVLRAINAKVE